ncbi:MAG: transcriptional regulator [Aquificae bacterium]|nr:transcriptional regulator [Aquificota bacterium]
MKFSVLVAIVSEELEDKAIDVAKQAGAGGVTILHGTGIGLKEKKIFFGLTYEGRESILVFVLERKLSLEVLKALNKELELEKEDHGLAFVLPIEHLAGINREEILKFQEKLKEEL